MNHPSTDLEALYDNLEHGVVFHQVVTDQHGRFVDAVFIKANPSFESITGLKRHSVIGARVSEVIPGIASARPSLMNLYRRVLTTGASESQKVFLSPMARWFKVFVFRCGPTQLCTVVQDINERVKAERELSASEQRFRSIVESSPLGIHMYELEPPDTLVFVGANKAADDVLGIENSQFIGKTIEQAFPPLAGTEVPARYRAAARTGEPWTTEQIVYEDEQIRGAFEVNAFQTAPNKMVAMFRDVTARKQSELAINAYAQAQEMLLREVNHRVKNNLSAIISIIHKEQDRCGDDGTPTRALSGLETRIRSLLNVHTLLSASSWRPLGVELVCDRLLSAVIASAEPGKLATYEVEPTDVLITSTQASHLALVLNELAVNSLKHVLPRGEKVHLSVHTSHDEDQLTLTFADDGPGYPEQLLHDIAGTGTGIGFDLISGIVRKNLKGTVELNNDHGAQTIIRFSLEHVQPEE